MNAQFITEGVHTPDALIAGNHHLLVGRKVTILAGQNRKCADVLGKVTASSKYVLSLSGSADGSQAPDAILAEDCDATAGDKQAMAYFRGDFNAAALTLGASHTVASITEGLRAKGIAVLASMS